MSMAVRAPATDTDLSARSGLHRRKIIDTMSRGNIDVTINLV